MSDRRPSTNRSVRYGAFLRAVNLGRNRRVTSAELRARFEELGFEDVHTFRTSGNVVFSAGPARVDTLTARIERALTDALGHEAVVYLRSASEIRGIADHQPFATALAAASSGKLQVALLARRPAADVRKRVLALASDEDRLAFGERELYWLPRAGTMESTLDRTAIEKLVGRWTMRTKGTIEQLAAKYLVD